MSTKKVCDGCDTPESDSDGLTTVRVEIGASSYPEQDLCQPCLSKFSEATNAAQWPRKTRKPRAAAAK